MPSREVASMWFRRRRRQPPPLLLPSLDLLAELVERVIALLDQTALAPRADPSEPATPVDGYVLFAPAAEGYRLLVRNGEAPESGEEVELDGERFSVLRLGPSPLPADSRRCAFLEGRNSSGRDEPSTGEGGEPDRGHARGAQGGPRARRAGPAAIARERAVADREARA